MFARTRTLLRWRSGSGLPAVFGLTILLPGLLLTVLGVRALVQERRFAEQQIRERLDAAAQIAVRDLKRGLHQWQVALDRLGNDRAETMDGLPTGIRASLEEPGAAALVFAGAGAQRVWPERQALYQEDCRRRRRSAGDWPLDEPAGLHAGMGVHPDGQRIAFGGESPNTRTVWALENFLPQDRAAR